MSSKKVVIFSAPSGAGKTTLVRHLLDKDFLWNFLFQLVAEHLGYMSKTVKITTFKPNRLQRKNSGRCFFEWEEVYEDMFYGTLNRSGTYLEKWKKSFLMWMFRGIKIKKHFAASSCCICGSPSIEELKNRLEGRNTETAESLQKRLGKAKEEMAQQDAFDIVIVNDDLDTARQEIMKKVTDFLNN